MEERKKPKASMWKMRQLPQHDCREWALAPEKAQGLEQEEQPPEDTK
jgi:hypothetical protein